MPLVTWNQTLASGIPSIDQEHQELIKRINELYQALIDKQEKNEIKKKLHDLVIHTSNHFKNEEEIMFLIKYPKHKEHAKEHEDLRTRIMRLEKNLHQDNSKSFGDDLFSFIKSWIMGHFLHGDKDFIDYTQSHNFTQI